MVPTAMRLFVLTLLVSLSFVGSHAADQGASRPATPAEIALFKEAMKNSAQDTEHWAYTETTHVEASKGKPKGDTITRFDPSKPYAGQFTPLQIEGKSPTEKQLKDYRKRGEKRGERVAQAAEAARNPAFVARPAPLRIAGTSVTPDLEHALIFAEQNGLLTFEVPVKSTRQDIPVDKLQVLVTVNRQTQLLENATIRIREAFRLKLIAKIKEGEASMDFTRIDPKFPPVVTNLVGDVSASILFIPITGNFARTRTDWQRVKSFDERLSVKLGPLQTLDF